MAKYVLTAAKAVGRADQTDRTFYAKLRPVIIGPRAALHRYGVVGEKTGISLGDYDTSIETVYDYPGKASDSTVDLDYVKLFADDADLHYLTKVPGDGHGTAMPSSTYANRVRASAYTFKTANGSDRSSAFADRDVKVGDIVKLSKTITAVLYSLTTEVTGFVGEAVAASTGAATADSNNAISGSASASVTHVASTPSNEVVATASGAAYESTADGYTTRTYTVTVTQGSTGSNATTAVLRVDSADGLDDQASVTPAAFSSPTSIGTKGLTVTFSIDAGSYNSAATYSEVDFVVGQQWTVSVTQALTIAVATAAGTYTGTQDDTYIVSVSRGGLYSATTKPQITVTTTNGSDSSGPTTITAAATPFAVGSYGVTISFSGTRLRKGDVYYVVVTAAAEGALQTITLKDNVPSALQGQDVNMVLAARRQGLEVPKVRGESGTPTTDWAATADGVTIQPNIKIFDSEFTSSGAEFSVSLGSATLYLQYREWVTDDAATVVSVSKPSDVATLLGDNDPDNPIGYGASRALANTSGELGDDPTRPAADTTDIVLCVPLGGDPSDTALWSAALTAVDNRDDAYIIVPLSTDAAVHALVKTHVDAQSADDVGFYCMGWLTATVAETVGVVKASTSLDGLAVTATIAATPATSPTAYTTVNASDNVEFIDLGVRAGDKVRINYTTDDDGDEIYTTYTVASVPSQTTLILSSGPTGVVTPARRIEVWRTPTKAELVTQLTDKAATYADSRILYWWPDTVGYGGTDLDGSQAVAAVAGLAGSVPSHQGLRNVGVEGVDDATRASKFFTSGQLDDLRAGGVAVVSETTDGRIYVYSASTTDPTSVSTKEEMIVRNGDMIRKAVQTEWEPYVGAGNVTSNIRQLLEGALASLSGRLKASNHTQELGPPVGNLQLTNIEAVTGQPDTITVTVTPTGVPAPLNQIRITLPVTVG